MDFSLSQEDESFRAEMREFLSVSLPVDIAQQGQTDYHPHRDIVRRWTRILNSKGWVAPHWPAKFGGTGWSPLQQHIFQDELRRARAPLLDRTALDLLGPVLCEFGTPAQRERFLPAILNGDEWWAQGFSEPGAGSDLASLATTARRQGDSYVVQGTKIWTSEAQISDWILVLARTEVTPRRQDGISFLLIDLRTPGITVSPIWTIDEGLTLNQVFFDDVVVPAANLIGEEGRGWQYAKFLLTHERTSSAVVSHTKRDVEQVRRLVSARCFGRKPLIEDPAFSARLARLQSEVLALEWAVLRVLQSAAGGKTRDVVASMLKLRGSELFERAALLGAEALGHAGLIAAPDLGADAVLWPDTPAVDVGPEGIGVASKAMYRRAATIYGGSSEIQRSIIFSQGFDLTEQ